MRKKSLAEVKPELVPQWSTINDLTPDQVSYGSSKKYWWTCEKGHSWEASAKNRVLAGSGCPYCEHRAVLEGYNDLQTVFPEVASTWSPKNEIKPSEVSPSSNKAVIWICKNGHEWKARVADRTDGHGCPYCAGQRVWKGYNDLATTHPNLAAEWSSKNKNISPETITSKNRSRVWWQCGKCGCEYQMVVYTRANGGFCPYCLAKEIKRLREQRLTKKLITHDLSYLLPQLAIIYYAGKQGLKPLTDTDEPTGLTVTAYIPDVNLVIDVCSNDKESKLKEYICDVHRIKYVRIPDNLTEKELIDRLCLAFSAVHLHIAPNAKDLERIKDSYSHWRKKSSEG